MTYSCVLGGLFIEIVEKQRKLKSSSIFPRQNQLKWNSERRRRITWRRQRPHPKYAVKSWYPWVHPLQMAGQSPILFFSLKGYFSAKYTGCFRALENSSSLLFAKRSFVTLFTVFYYIVTSLHFTLTSAVCAG